MASRSYCFTLNNYTPEEAAAIATAPVRYLIYGIEQGKEGTPHLQGYLELAKPIRITGAKKLPGLARAHFEVRKGTRDQARAYCMKDGQTTEIGDWSAGGQGTRTDLKKLLTDLKDGKPMKAIIEDDPELASRHLRLIDRYTAITDKEQTKEFRQVETHVLYGDAGTGKSKDAREKAGDYFTVNPEDSFPFDGYAGEKTIIMDDFYGGIKYHQLLNILDGHQLRINVKGGHRYARWNTVYITSNKQPSEWYRHGLTPALERRLTTVTEYKLQGGGVILDPPPIDTDLAAELDKI